MLIEQGADLLIHLGDIGSVEVIDALAATHPTTGSQIEAHAVLGNCDHDADALARYAQDLGVEMHPRFGAFEIDGKRIVFTHGHLGSVLQDAIADGTDYLLHGHTHLRSDDRVGKTRVINPGALFRAAQHTVALLTPASGGLRVLEVAGVAR